MEKKTAPKEQEITLQEYHFPALGITVKASSLEDAEKQLHILTQEKNG